MIGEGAHYRQLIAEGVRDSAKLIAIGNNRTRKKCAEEHAGFDGQWDRHVSFMARTLTPIGALGEGTQLCAFALIHHSVKCGRHVIVNCGAVVHHDVELGDFCFVAPGAQVLGNAKIGEGCWIGANATVIQGTEVPPWTEVRSNSVWPCDYKPHGRRKVKAI